MFVSVSYGLYVGHVKLQRFFLSGTVCSVRFTSILESLDVNLVSLGGILMVLGAPGQGSGFLWGLFGDGSTFGVSTARNTPTFWSPLWRPKFEKSQKIANTQWPESSAEKMCSQSSPEMA